MRTEKNRAHNNRNNKKRAPRRPEMLLVSNYKSSITEKSRVVGFLAPKKIEDVKVFVRLTNHSGHCECIVDIEDKKNTIERRIQITESSQSFVLDDIKAGAVVFISINTNESIGRAFVTLTGK